MIDLVVDAAYGDTGKARIVDKLIDNYDILARFSGSSNAGHTIVLNGKKYITRLLPSGILHPNKTLVIAQGVLIDVQTFLNELEEFKDFDVLSRLVVSNKAHLVLPYHKMVDTLREEVSNNPIGSTKNGVSVCMADKVSRRGIRVQDIFSSFTLRENIEYWNSVCKFTYENATGKKYSSYLEPYEQYNRIIDLLDKFKSVIKDNVKDTSVFINEQNDKGKSILLEAAQGIYLDPETGFYPYITSTYTTPAGACIGTGIAPKKLNKVIGLTKAYTTRVGNGPMDGELFDDVGKKIAEVGNEFGSITGRARRIGWLNLKELKYAEIIGGFDCLAITKCDVLNNIDPICAITDDGKIEFKGWSDINDPNFSLFVDYVEKYVGVPIKYISYGAERDDILIKD